MSPIGPHHAGFLNRLTRLVNAQLESSFIVATQNPIRLDDLSEPEPDMAILHYRDDFYADAHPTPADILLLIEISDSTLAYDREEKLPRYAAANIPEVVIFDLNAQLVEQYAQPHAGSYQLKRTLTRDETLISVTLPTLQLLLGQVFAQA